MLATKTRQDGARRRPGGDRKLEKIGFGSQDGSETDSESILDGFLMISGLEFGRILGGFEVDF